MAMWRIVQVQRTLTRTLYPLENGKKRRTEVGLVENKGVRQLEQKAF